MVVEVIAMNFFKFFKKRKKVEEVELSVEDLKWNKMWDLWINGEIEIPYAELMEYLNGVNNGGHHCHLDNVNGNRDLKEYVSALTEILPEPLKSNVLLAYNAYSKNPDDVSDENDEVLSNCDSVYYENEEMVNDILKNRASKIEL